MQVSSSSSVCGQRRAFLDCGANDGQSLRWFERNIMGQSSSPYTDVVAFEMNPFFVPDLTALLQRLPRGQLEQAAVWTQDGFMDAHMQLPGSRTAVKHGMLYYLPCTHEHMPLQHTVPPRPL